MASRTYKAKRKNWRELPKEKWWVEGAVFEGKENSYIITNVKVTDEWEDSEIGADVIGYLVDPETICQDTEMTDKNGRKIFEGDIVKGVAYSTDFIGYIVWIDAIAGFGVRYFNKRREPTAWENSSILKAIQRWKHPNEFQAEIIGNIFDNPELIGE